LARRYLAIVVICGVLLLSVGSLLANPLLKFLGTASNQIPSAQGVRSHGKVDDRLRPYATSPLPPARSGLSGPASGQESITAGPQALESAQVPGGTSQNGTPEGIGRMLGGLTKWWGDKLSGARRLWTQVVDHSGGMTWLAGAPDGSPGTHNPAHPPSNGDVVGAGQGGTASGSGGSSGSTGAGGSVPNSGTPPPGSDPHGSGASAGAAAGSGYAGGGTDSPPSPPLASPPPSPPTRGQARWFTTEYPEVPDWNDARSAQYDIHIFQAGVPGSTSVDAAKIQRLRALNPNVKVLVYIFPQITWGWDANFKDEWAVLSNGKRIKNPGDPNDMILMNINNAEYRKYIIGQIVDVVNQLGFDGVFNDGVWPTVDLGQEWVGWTPRPPQAALDNWHAWSLTFFKELKQALGAKLLITNTTYVTDDGNPKHRDDDFLSVVDGTMLEGYIHAPWDGADVNNADWWPFQQRMLVRNVTAGKYFLGLSGADASGDSQKRWRDMTLDSYLLFADGQYAMYSFGDFGAWPDQLQSGARIGWAAGAAVQSGLVGTRDFTAGTVTVDVQSGTGQISLK